MEKNKANYEKTIVIPIEKSMWQSLRRIAFEEEISMSQLTRTALEKLIKKYDKSVAL